MMLTSLWFKQVKLMLCSVLRKVVCVIFLCPINYMLLSLFFFNTVFCFRKCCFSSILFSVLGNVVFLQYCVLFWEMSSVFLVFWDVLCVTISPMATSTVVYSYCPSKCFEECCLIVCLKFSYGHYNKSYFCLFPIIFGIW